MTHPIIFNRARVKQHRDRASGDTAEHDFLLREMAARLAERLDDITRRFPVALNLGAHHGVLAEAVAGKGGIETLVQCDLSQKLIAKASGIRLVADEEMIPFADNSFDLVMSCGSLQWVNDVPGTLIQIQRILKPDGLFLAMLPGGETLKELRASLEAAEVMHSGGLSPRVSPFIDVRDGGSLLQRAGFALPVVDSEVITVTYDHPLKLLHELRGMGQSNALAQSRKGFTPCSLIMQAMDHYLRHYADDNWRVNASFDMLTMTGWKPHASQQQPLARGSGQVNLKDALN